MKGEESYTNRHARVYEVRGRAADHTCVDCQKPACDWSQVAGTDGSLPEHYEPRCKPCHFNYDDIGGQISKAKKGVPQTPEHRAAISAGMLKAGAKPRTQKQLDALARARQNSPVGKKENADEV